MILPLSGKVQELAPIARNPATAVLRCSSYSCKLSHQVWTVGKREIPYVGFYRRQATLVRYKLRKQLGRFLRAKRGNATLLQFAKKLGISDSTLQRLEIGEQNITIDTLESILRRLKVSVVDVFGKGDKE